MHRIATHPSGVRNDRLGDHFQSLSAMFGSLSRSVHPLIRPSNAKAGHARKKVAVKYAAYPRFSVAHPEKAPDMERVKPNSALRSAYCVAAYSFSQMFIIKARKGAVPSPPQKDSTTEAAYMSHSEGGRAAAAA